MIVLGLLLGLVGTDIYTGTPRFTFGIRELCRRPELRRRVAVGVFGIAEILRNLENETIRDGDGQEGRRTSGSTPRGLPPHGRARSCAAPPSARCSASCPAAAHVLASFASYTVEKQLSKHPEEFGKGAIEGVAGPESANNAGAQTSLHPDADARHPGATR